VFCFAYVLWGVTALASLISQINSLDKTDAAIFPMQRYGSWGLYIFQINYTYLPFNSMNKSVTGW